MKPMNFPERRRQRQLGALARLKPTTKAGESNDHEAVTLHERTARNLRDVRTKKHLADGSVARRERHGGKLKRA